MDDVITGWRWALKHLGEYLGPVERLSLGGASAGASLSLSTAKQLRDQHQPVPASLVLVYPVVHAELPPLVEELRSAVDNAPEGAVLLSSEQVRALTLNHVGDESLLNDGLAVPGEGNLADLPPTLIINSQHDTLRASGQKLAQQLASSRVLVVAETEPGTTHGHLNTPEEPGAVRTIKRLADWLSHVPESTC